MGSGQPGRGEEQLSCTLCRGSQLSWSLAREGALLSLPVGLGQGLGRETHLQEKHRDPTCCWHKPATGPSQRGGEQEAGGECGGLLFLHLLPFQGNNCHPPSQVPPPKASDSLGCCSGQDGAVAIPQIQHGMLIAH